MEASKQRRSLQEFDIEEEPCCLPASVPILKPPSSLENLSGSGAVPGRGPRPAPILPSLYLEGALLQVACRCFGASSRGARCTQGILKIGSPSLVNSTDCSHLQMVGFSSNSVCLCSAPFPGHFSRKFPLYSVLCVHWFCVYFSRPFCLLLVSLPPSLYLRIFKPTGIWP